MKTARISEAGVAFLHRGLSRSSRKAGCRARTCIPGPGAVHLLARLFLGEAQDLRTKPIEDKVQVSLIRSAVWPESL